MKIKLYINVHEDTQREELEYINLEIKGKVISYSLLPQTQKDVFEGIYEFTNRFFSYKYDDRYKNLIKNVNCEIFIKKSTLEANWDYLDGSTIGGLDGYCYLSLLQRLKLSWNFKNTEIQKSENIKWLASIPISILTTYITTLILK